MSALDIGQEIKGATCLVYLLGHMRIDHRGIETSVSEKKLDGSYVCSGFEQMGGKAVAQGMWRDLFPNTCLYASFFAYCLHG